MIKESAHPKILFEDLMDEIGNDSFDDSAKIVEEYGSFCGKPEDLDPVKYDFMISLNIFTEVEDDIISPDVLREMCERMNDIAESSHSVLEHTLPVVFSGSPEAVRNENVHQTDSRYTTILVYRNAYSFQMAMNVSFKSLKKIFMFILSMYNCHKYVRVTADRSFAEFVADGSNWRVLSTMQGRLIDVMALILKGQTKYIVESAKHSLFALYQYLRKMFSGSDFDFGMQFSELTQDDGSDGFIKETLEYCVQQPQRRGDVRTIRISGKAKEMLSSIIYDTDTFRRIECRADIAMCQYLRQKFVNFRRIVMNENAEKIITKSRRNASKIVLKTVDGGIDFLQLA